VKKRIQIDSTIVSFFIVLTGLLYAFPWLYTTNQPIDNVLDLLGFLYILKGTYLRMAARGYKKAHSLQGAGLVMTGLYQYTRNPMYLGSFLIGVGFVLIVWPWWSLPIYAMLFYARFMQQIKIEEKHLKKMFGKVYENYCQRVPRFFPPLRELWKMNVRKIFSWQETWSTKERYGLFSWPALAVIMESVQQRIVFGSIDLGQTLIILLGSALLFTMGLLWRYNTK
jgi:protein-S-isoprenylcysteine O-methyltransferase Ste14